jgi:hypothetical protein
MAMFRRTFVSSVVAAIAGFLGLKLPWGSGEGVAEYHGIYGMANAVKSKAAFADWAEVELTKINLDMDTYKIILCSCTDDSEHPNDAAEVVWTPLGSDITARWAILYEDTPERWWHRFRFWRKDPIVAVFDLDPST